jgi:glycosyltransferase involved in cell wall biosynthesis
VPAAHLTPSGERPPATPASALLVTPRWARDGGVGAHVQASAAVLARAGIEVTVLVGRIESEERFPGVSVRREAALNKVGEPISARLGDVLDGEPQIAHLHQVDDPEVVAAIQPSAPVVVSAHGYTACTAGVHYFRPGSECMRPHGPACIPHLIACAHARDPRRLPAKYRYASRGLAALRSADHAVSYSSAVDRHLAINRVGRRSIVPYFPTFEAHPEATEPSGRQVLFAGRVVPSKGVAVLIRAAREVDAEFLVCGDGWRLAAMRRLAGRLGVSARVHFPGWLAPADLAREIARSCVVALPSVWPEPFGLIGIEALAAGRPVVASATGGVGDWLEHGVSGLCVPAGSHRALARALQELLSDPSRSRAMGEAGRRAVASSFSAERHLEALLDVYRQARARWRSASHAQEAGLTLAGAPTH